MLILGIESSCDETAASIIEGKKEKIKVLSNVISSQIEIHKKYNGVCPYDQPSFRIALWKSKVKVCTLPVEYNIRSLQNSRKQIKFHYEFGEDHCTPRMYHMHHGKSNLQDALSFCEENHQPYLS